MKYEIKRNIKKLDIQNPQINALKTLGYEYIIVGQQRKRVYALNKTDIGKLSKYATFDGLAIPVNRFPMFIIEAMEKNTLYII